MLRVLDLFSCLGTHAIGLANAGGFVTVRFIESSPWRRAHLDRRFPGVPQHDDVRTFAARRGEAHVVIGGPPCKRTSVAAAVRGSRDGSSLWPDMLRIGVDVATEWFVVEQPPGNAAWEDQVADDLQRTGYHAARIEFAASDCGAPYIRRRVFILACTDLSRLEVAWAAIPREIAAAKRASDARGYWHPGQLESLRVDARGAGELDPPASWDRIERIDALGDSNPPVMMEVIGRAIRHAVGDKPQERDNDEEDLLRSR